MYLLTVVPGRIFKYSKSLVRGGALFECDVSVGPVLAITQMNALGVVRVKLRKNRFSFVGKDPYHQRIKTFVLFQFSTRHCMLGHEGGAGAQALHQVNSWEKNNRRARGPKEEQKGEKKKH